MSNPHESTLKMTSGSIDEKEDALSQQMCDLAGEIERARGAGQRELQATLQKLVKKSLLQKNDEVMYDALERARFAEPAAYLGLKATIEEAAETVFIRRDDKTTFEVNAFAIPLFVRSAGGLRQEQAFSDQQAFEQLTASLQEAGLESPAARVVLISHAYHLDEIDGISYSHLNEMVRDAAASIMDKRGAEISAIERSFAGWPEHHFAADEEAVELRFLLGFALKKTDDPFYQAPADEAAADAWFEARALRFQAWTEGATPLVQRCLVNDGRAASINFLYQDMFHGAKETGVGEYHMLQMMADLRLALEEKNLAPEDVNAIIAPANLDSEMVLRVKLHATAGGALVTSAQKPLDAARDLSMEIDDAADALETIGIRAISVAMRFDAAGNPVKLRAYE